MTDPRLERLQELSQSLKFPDELGGVFLPADAPKSFEIMFIGEMPSMNEPLQLSSNGNYNFNVTARDKFFQEMMCKYRCRRELCHGHREAPRHSQEAFQEGD